MTTDKWYTIPQDARVWSSTHKTHKMGWVRAGAMIHVVEEYGSWFRFVEYRQPVDLNSFGGGYIEYWVAGGALGSEVEPDLLIAPRPVPAFQTATQAGDAELGAALRLIVNFILRR